MKNPNIAVLVGALALGSARLNAAVLSAPLTAAPGLTAMFGPIEQPQMQAWQEALGPFFELHSGPNGAGLLTSDLFPNRVIPTGETSYDQLLEATARAFIAAGHNTPEEVSARKADILYLIEAIQQGVNNQAQALRSADPAALAQVLPTVESLMPVYERHFTTDNGRSLQVALLQAKGQDIEGKIRRTETELGKAKDDRGSEAPAAAQIADSPHLTLLEDLVQELKDSSDSDDDERTIARINKLVGKRQDQRLQLAAVRGLGEYLENADDDNRKNEARDVIVAIAGDSPHAGVQIAAVEALMPLAADEDFSDGDEAIEAVETLAKESPFMEVKRAAQTALSEAAGEASDGDISDKLFDASLAVLASYPEQAAPAQIPTPAAQAAQSPQGPVESPHKVMALAVLDALQGSRDSDDSKKYVTRLETLAKGRFEPDLLTLIVEGLIADMGTLNDYDYDLHVMQALGNIAKKMAYYPVHNLILRGLGAYIKDNTDFSSVGDMVEVIEKIAKAGTLAVKQESLAALGSIYQHADSSDDKDAAFDAFERVLASDKALTPAAEPVAQTEEAPIAPLGPEDPYLQIGRSMAEALGDADAEAGKRIVDRLKTLAQARAQEALHLLIIDDVLKDVVKANNTDYEDYAIGRLEEIINASPFASARRATVAGLLAYLADSENPDPNVGYVTEVIGRLATTPWLKSLAVEKLLAALEPFDGEDQSKMLAAAQAILDSEPSLSPKPEAPAAQPEAVFSREGQPSLRSMVAQTVIGLLEGRADTDPGKKFVDRLQALARGADPALQRQILMGLAGNLAQAEDSDYAAYVIRALEAAAEDASVKPVALSAVIGYMADNPGFKYRSYGAEAAQRLALASDDAVKRQAIEGLSAAYGKTQDPALLDAAHKIAGASPELAAQGSLPKLPKPKVELPFKNPRQLLAAMVASLAAAGVAYGLLALGQPWLALAALAGLMWVAVTGIAARHSLAALAQIALLGAYAVLPTILKTALAPDHYLTWVAGGGWLLLMWTAVQSLKYGRLRTGLAVSLVAGAALQTALHWDRLAPLLRGLGLPV